MREPFLTHIVRSFNINKTLLRGYARKYLDQITEESECVFRFGELAKQILTKKEYTYDDFMGTKIYAFFNFTKIMSINSAEVFEQDYIRNNMYCLQLWVEQPSGTRKYYRIGKNFGEELLLSDISVSPKAIIKYADCFPIIFDFHKPIAEPDGRMMYSAIVYIGKSTNNDDWCMVVHGMGLNSQKGFSTTYITFIVKQDGISFQYDLKHTEEQKTRADTLIKYAMRCFLYIHSGNPDLRELRPETMTKNQRKDLEKELGIDLRCPQTLVSWNWKKPVEYNVDSTIVSGHFRWQPCGTGRSNVQLTWVREHIRTYNEKQKENT